MSWWRVIFRRGGRALLRFLFQVLTRLEVRGLERMPAEGPLLVAFNHLAHLDGPLIVAFLPREVEGIALSDLYEVPVTGQLLRLYGTIPVYRDEFDRAVLRRALAVLAEGKALALAPEARMSVTGALERARHGVAYLALRSGAPILPVALTGTELIPGTLTRLQRAPVTMTVGPGLPSSSPRSGSRPSAGPGRGGHGGHHAPHRGPAAARVSGGVWVT